MNWVIFGSVVVTLGILYHTVGRITGVDYSYTTTFLYFAGVLIIIMSKVIDRMFNIKSIKEEKK